MPVGGVYECGTPRLSGADVPTDDWWVGGDREGEVMSQPTNSTEALALIRKLTKAQRGALDNMGANMHPRCATKTLDALERLGLIEGEDVILPGRFPVKVRHHTVPIFVHIAWCELCSEEIEQEEGTEVVKS